MSVIIISLATCLENDESDRKLWFRDLSSNSVVLKIWHRMFEINRDFYEAIKYLIVQIPNNNGVMKLVF